LSALLLFDLDNHGYELWFSLQFFVHSQHQYQPRLHICRIDQQTGNQVGTVSSFIFPETSFIAVTVYQNEQVQQSSHTEKFLSNVWNSFYVLERFHRIFRKLISGNDRAIWVLHFKVLMFYFNVLYHDSNPFSFFFLSTKPNEWVQCEKSVKHYYSILMAKRKCNYRIFEFGGYQICVLRLNLLGSVVLYQSKQVHGKFRNHCQSLWIFNVLAKLCFHNLGWSKKYFSVQNLWIPLWKS